MIENCGECGRRWYCYIDPRECDKLAHSVSVTNADRIRAMTDEELDLWICGVYDIEEENGKFINGMIIPGYTLHDIEEWLQQPAEEVDNGKAD